MSPFFTIQEAATKLRKSEGWLWDWLGEHPIDGADVPFFRSAGRTKLFREADIDRMRAAIDQIEAVPTLIYFIGMEGHIKIGRADDWKKRFSAIQTGSPFKCTILLVLKATRAREKELHGLFADHHVRGEWFRDGAEIQSYIECHRGHCLTRSQSLK